MFFSHNHDDEQAPVGDFLHRCFPRALEIVCTFPDWQDAFVERMCRAGVDALTAAFIYDVLCVAAECRAAFPGQDARLLEAARAW